MKPSDKHGFGSFIGPANVHTDSEPIDGSDSIAQVEEHDTCTALPGHQVEVGRNGGRSRISLEGTTFEDVAPHDDVAGQTHVHRLRVLVEALVAKVLVTKNKLEAVDGDGHIGAVRDGDECEQGFSMVSDEDLLYLERNIDLLAGEFEDLVHAVLCDFAEHGQCDRFNHDTGDSSIGKNTTAGGIAQGRRFVPTTRNLPVGQGASRRRRNLSAIVFLPGRCRVGIHFRKGDPTEVAVALAKYLAPKSPVLIQPERHGYVRARAFPVNILVWR